jgi:predicted alpha/beta-hydrolase family hydrolase
MIASGDMNHEQLIQVSEALANAGFVVVRFTCTGPMATRVKVFRSAIELLNTSTGKYPVKSVIMGGRSMGCRFVFSSAHSHNFGAAHSIITYRAALETANAHETPGFIAGLVFYAYPLHPPGDKGNLRDVPIINAKIPLLFFTGTKDAFCDIDLLHKTIAKMKNKEEFPPRLELMDGCDHSFKAKGGKAVMTANMARICSVSIKWAKNILAESIGNNEKSETNIEALSDGGEDNDDDDEVALMNPKKRKAPLASGKPNAETETKKLKTLDSFLTKSDK